MLSSSTPTNPLSSVAQALYGGCSGSQELDYELSYLTISKDSLHQKARLAFVLTDPDGTIELHEHLTIQLRAIRSLLLNHLTPDIISAHKANPELADGLRDILITLKKPGLAFRDSPGSPQIAVGVLTVLLMPDKPSHRNSSGWYTDICPFIAKQLVLLLLNDEDGTFPRASFLHDLNHILYAMSMDMIVLESTRKSEDLANQRVRINSLQSTTAVFSDGSPTAPRSSNPEPSQLAPILSNADGITGPDHPHSQFVWYTNEVKRAPPRPSSLSRYTLATIPLNTPAQMKTTMYGYKSDELQLSAETQLHHLKLQYKFDQDLNVALHPHRVVPWLYNVGAMFRELQGNPQRALLIIHHSIARGTPLHAQLGNLMSLAEMHSSSTLDYACWVIRFLIDHCYDDRAREAADTFRRNITRPPNYNFIAWLEYVKERFDTSYPIPVSSATFVRELLAVFSTSLDRNGQPFSEYMIVRMLKPAQRDNYELLHAHIYQQQIISPDASDLPSFNLIDGSHSKRKHPDSDRGRDSTAKKPAIDIPVSDRQAQDLQLVLVALQNLIKEHSRYYAPFCNRCLQTGHFSKVCTGHFALPNSRCQRCGNADCRDFQHKRPCQAPCMCPCARCGSEDHRVNACNAASPVNPLPKEVKAAIDNWRSRSRSSSASRRQ